MLQKGIPSIPNIFVLHRIMTCQKYDKHSIVLIKYLTTQCMQIDFNSPFETLENEYEDCSRLLLTPGSNAEEVKQQMRCIKNLEGLHDISETEKSARGLMQEMEDKNIKIPDDLQSQFDKDCRIAEEMRGAAPLVQMQHRLHKLWKEGRKLSPQEQEITKAINEARALIDTLKAKGVPIPEEFIDLLERDIRDAKKLLTQ